MAFLATWDQVPKVQLLEVRHQNVHDCHTSQPLAELGLLHDLLPDDSCPAAQITGSRHVLFLQQHNKLQCLRTLHLGRCLNGATLPAWRRCAPTSACSTAWRRWA